MSTHEAIPFLPGNSFTDVRKTDFRRSQTLDYRNGYSIKRIPRLGIGLTPIEHTKPIPASKLLQFMGQDPTIIYRDKQYHTARAQPRFIPAHVAFDKVVCRFDAYFKQTVHESVEQYHLRKVRIYYYVEDDSISVVEPPVENSGIPQGVLIKRHRIPKSSTEYYTIKDFNLGINVEFYGKVFRIASCDKFTQDYMRETEKITLNPPEEIPPDPHQIVRNTPLRNPHLETEKNDKLKRFLQNDRKVLRFYCSWDDRDSMFGELREFIIHYYLVDDCVEVREVQKPNNGRDPFPILLRRQQLPRKFSHVASANSAKYTWKDFKIGQTIDVLGREFLIHDCDEYTKKYYQDAKLNLYAGENKSMPTGNLWTQFTEQELPPYNGFGSIEDSLGSCKYLVLKPPKKDFIKMLENEHKVLRFVAKMVTKHKEDKDRRFVISYRLADDMMTIYEPPQRNAGIMGGKFMERTRVLKPGNTLSTMPEPEYYVASDLYVGAVIEVFKHRFLLMDADEYVFNYMEQLPNRFDKSNVGKVVEKAKSRLSPNIKNVIVARLEKADKENTGKIDRKILLEVGKDLWKDVLTDHEVITLSRTFEDSSRKVSYLNLLNSLFK